MATFNGLLSIIIPVYNEEDTVINVIRMIQEVPIRKEIIVVDDFSTDLTRERLKKFDSEIMIVLHDRNKGKGAAIRTGMQYASGDALIIQDADLEYNPSDILLLLENLDSETPVVYGSRFLGHMENMSGLHRYGNLMLTGLTNMLFGLKITDMETCYKLMAKEVYSQLDIQSDRFNMEPEITAKIARMGYNIIEIGITYRGRDFAEGKKISWKDGFSAVYALLKFRFGKIGKKVKVVEKGIGDHL